MKTCSLCGAAVIGNRCPRCGMPWYDDDGVRYHINETARDHEKHHPDSRVFSPYMEPRKQKQLQKEETKKREQQLKMDYQAKQTQPKSLRQPAPGHKPQEKKKSKGAVVLIWVVVIYIFLEICGALLSFLD